jgi:hypothetical protein
MRQLDILLTLPAINQASAVLESDTVFSMAGDALD